MQTRCLAAYRLVNAKLWKQFFTDGTRRRHTEIVNGLIRYLDKDDKYRTCCLNGAMIPEDGTAEEQCKTIMAEFKSAQKLLQGWLDETAEMYPDDAELLAMIPPVESLSVARLVNAHLSHDTCAAAQLLGHNIGDEVMASAREHADQLGLNENEIKTYQGNCFNHLRNIWLEAIELHLARKLREHLQQDLALIPPDVRVSTKLRYVWECIANIANANPLTPCIVTWLQ